MDKMTLVYLFRKNIDLHSSHLHLQKHGSKVEEGSNVTAELNFPPFSLSPLRHNSEGFGQTHLQQTHVKLKIKPGRVDAVWVLGPVPAAPRAAESIPSES